MNNISFSNICKSARELLGWKQTELCDKSGVAISSIRRIETGAKNISDSTIKKLILCFEKKGLAVIDNNKEILIKLNKQGLINKNIIFGRTDPIVINAFVEGSNIIKNISDHYPVNDVKYNWNDKILDDLSRNKIDISIYNTNRSKKYINNRSLDNLEIIEDICYSMGGDNFFLIGKSKYWERMNIENFSEYLDDNKTIIIASVNSDNMDNLSNILDINHPNLKIINLELSNLKKEIFHINEKILVYGNQNIRYNLLYDNNFTEVLNIESIGREDIRKIFKSNSNNSIIINKNIYDKISKERLINSIQISKNNFYELFSNKNEKENFLNKIKNDLDIEDISNDKKNYILENILYKTYRLSI